MVRIDPLPREKLRCLGVEDSAVKVKNKGAIHATSLSLCGLPNQLDPFGHLHRELLRSNGLVVAEVFPQVDRTVVCRYVLSCALRRNPGSALKAAIRVSYAKSSASARRPPVKCRQKRNTRSACWKSLNFFYRHPAR